jgi:hypothetical protein
MILWALVICFVLSACAGQVAQPLPMPTVTPKTFNTVIPSPTQTLTALATSTLTYPLKQVLLDYTTGGYHTPYELYYADYGMERWSTLVLYTDGQLIIPGKTFQQKILSKEEINQLFSRLETLGFFSLAQDKLYDFGNQEPPRIYDGTTYCVVTAGERRQNLCAYEPHESFLASEMKNVLHFLNDYQLKEMKPYFLIEFYCGCETAEVHM